MNIEYYIQPGLHINCYTNIKYNFLIYFFFMEKEAHEGRSAQGLRRSCRGPENCVCPSPCCVALAARRMFWARLTAFAFPLGQLVPSPGLFLKRRFLRTLANLFPTSGCDRPSFNT